ncbi:MAG: MBL fold metallo-hydrolase [Methanocalculus sp. MSAO_Arc1]|uniref:MBL fold metallo-hydrolase n=1 Tax=Methanocalculus TaxID=71151 RepID=UPI000FF09FB7|nr:MULTISPECIES: MBL fold metallo-hydrolase [unclassified Methanocalculus]MCP1661417.1 glyoxylase-like metal-dependent hydrolase (beta-lactamase superfamily II) [Methanocalculus sp. AMF5]RQD79693.1 MAG: MBL fold metallo-hydrolase [Methanocalculus sp. MSAO_Arc1]
MKIINLTEDSEVYTSNVYLVTGTWNALSDQNTLIDVGRDPLIFEKIQNARTGVGKRKLDQVILTHSHYDHAMLTPEIRELFSPRIYAFSNSLKYIDIILKGDEIIRIGDREFEVIHTPGHTHDSICLYCEEDGVLFAGDTPVIIRVPGSTYDEAFLEAMLYIATKDVREIYFGHGRPMLENCNVAIRNSIMNMKKSRVVSIHL